MGGAERASWCKRYRSTTRAAPRGLAQRTTTGTRKPFSARHTPAASPGSPAARGRSPRSHPTRGAVGRGASPPPPCRRPWPWGSCFCRPVNGLYRTSIIRRMEKGTPCEQPREDGGRHGHTAGRAAASPGHRRAHSAGLSTGTHWKWAQDERCGAVGHLARGATQLVAAVQSVREGEREAAIGGTSTPRWGPGRWWRGGIPRETPHPPTTPSRYHTHHLGQHMGQERALDDGGRHVAGSPGNGTRVAAGNGLQPRVPSGGHVQPRLQQPQIGRRGGAAAERLRPASAGAQRQHCGGQQRARAAHHRRGGVQVVAGGGVVVGDVVRVAKHDLVPGAQRLAGQHRVGSSVAQGVPQPSQLQGRGGKERGQGKGRRHTARHICGCE